MSAAVSRKNRSKKVKPLRDSQGTQVVKKPISRPPISNVFNLSAQSMRILWSYKGFFSGVLLIYLFVSLILAGSVGTSVDVTGIRDQLGNRALGSLAAFLQLVGSTGSPDQAAGVYQLFLNLFLSLALLWGLRQVYAGSKVRIRDAYYKGMYPIIPYMLIIAFIGVQLLPMLIGSISYQVALATGIATSALVQATWLAAALLLTLGSLYFVAATILALIVVTLPDTAPIQALKVARRIAAGRRWTLLRKMLFLPLLVIVLSSLIMLPVILLVPVIAQAVLVVLTPIIIAIAHSYAYVVYREFIND